MGKLMGFSDSKVTCWSRLELSNGDPIYISVAQSGVLVKKSRLGIMGAKLYNETNVYNAAMTAKSLHAQITLSDDPSVIQGYTLPSDMTNPVLRSFTQAALNSNSAAELSVRLNEAL